MKQKINPTIIAVTVVVVLCVTGITAYFINNKPASAPPPVPGADKSMQGLSPDQQIQARIKKLQEGGGR